MRRRRVLVGLAGAYVWAQSRAKVYLDYDQAELDRMYDQSVYAPNQAEVQRRNAAASERTRAKLGAPLRISYGASPTEQLDIFRATAQNAPVMVFIHGGAWNGGSAAAYAFQAETFVTAGAHYVAPDFARVSDLGGSLSRMLAQVQDAIEWVRGNAAMFGGDAGRVYLAAHSSGAHLAAAALTMLSAGTVQAALLVSGIYDLRGARLSKRSEYLRIDDAEEGALSPIRHIETIRVPLTIAYGNRDNPEFRRQSRAFASALQVAGKRVETIVGEGNHFEFGETLGSPQGVLGRAALRMMKLA